MSFIGVDIGGTKIDAAVVGLAPAPRILLRERRATPTAGPRAVMACVLDVVKALRVRLTGVDAVIDAVGVGAPGIVDVQAGRVIAASRILTAWAGTEIAGPLHDALALPVFVDNDVRTMARAEAKLGAGRDLADCLYVAFGTGVGGAVSEHTDTGECRIRRGAHASVGEIAHLMSPVAGTIACGCGHRQHLESIASGPAISAEYSQRAGVDVDMHDVARRLAAGDALARTVVVRAGSVAGEILAGVVSAFDLDGVVLAGGALNVGTAFPEAIASSLRVHLWPRGRPLVVKQAALGADAAVVGAALLAHDSLCSAFGMPGRAAPT